MSSRSMRVALAAAVSILMFLGFTQVAQAATGTPTDSSNLSPNAVLASSSTGYSIQQGGTGLTRVAVSDHVAAAYALRVTESSTTTRVRAPRVAVTPGTTYTWAADVKANATAQVQITVSWFSSSGAFLSYSAGTMAPGFSQTSWTRAQATLVPPAGAAQGETVVNVLSGTKNAYVYVTQHDVTPPASTTSPAPAPTPDPAPDPAPAPAPAPTTITNLPGQPALTVYGSSTGISTYAQPGALVIAGRDQYADQGFKDISAAGGTVLMYLDAPLLNDWGTYAAMLDDASACGPAVPQWGSYTANQWGALADFRVGGVLQSKLHCVLEQMVADNPHMGGFFADDLGSRSWYPNINWSSFDQQAWRDGAIALAQTFHDVAAEHHLMFMVNGTWTAGTLADNGGGYPTMSSHGLSLADGGYIEHHAASELSYWVAYAQGQWGTAAGDVSLGHPFMYVQASTESIRQTYDNAGVFAFSSAQSDYGIYPPPWGPFHPTGLPSRVAQ